MRVHTYTGSERIANASAAANIYLRLKLNHVTLQTHYGDGSVVSSAHVIAANKLV